MLMLCGSYIHQPTVLLFIAVDSDKGTIFVCFSVTINAFLPTGPQLPFGLSNAQLSELVSLAVDKEGSIRQSRFGSGCIGSRHWRFNVVCC